MGSSRAYVMTAFQSLQGIRVNLGILCSRKFSFTDSFVKTNKDIDRALQTVLQVADGYEAQLPSNPVSQCSVHSSFPSSV